MERSSQKKECYVDIWSIDLRAYIGYLREMMPILSREEQDHARRFRFEKDRQRYIGSHGCCRRILSRYLQIAPQEIVLEKGDDGKPWIQVPTGMELHFNLTHAGDYAYVAVSNRPVGIDIEQIDQTLPYAEITPQFMSVAEQVIFDELPSIERPIAFYCCWTRKEAYVKALGKGLSYPIRQVTVSLDPEQTEPWVDTYQPAERRKWQMFPLVMPSGYLGAVTCQGEGINYFSVAEALER